MKIVSVINIYSKYILSDVKLLIRPILYNNKVIVKKCKVICFAQFQRCCEVRMIIICNKLFYSYKYIGMYKD